MKPAYTKEEILFQLAMAILLYAIWYAMKNWPEFARFKSKPKKYPTVKKADTIKIVQLDEFEEHLS